MSKPKIAFVDTGWNQNEFRRKNNAYGGIGYYRIVKPAQYLREWFDVDVIAGQLKDMGDYQTAFAKLATDYDLIFTKHIDNPIGCSNLLAAVQHFGKKLIVDMDDNFLQLREDNDAHKTYAEFKGGRYFLGALMGLSNGLTVSTQPLKETYDEYLRLFPTYPPPADILPNCNDVDDWKYKRRLHTDKKVRIGFAGSITHGDDLELVYEPLADILQRFPNTLLYFIGAIDPEKMKYVEKKIQSYRKLTSFKDRIGFFGGTDAWNGTNGMPDLMYPEFLMSFGLDIGIAPLVNEPFNQCKSHIKWLEYSMIGIPTVASKVYPYFQPIQGTPTIEHNQTGLLCETKEDWVKNLEHLVKNEKARIELSVNAYNHIKDNWQYKQHIHKWKAVIDKYV